MLVFCLILARVSESEFHEVEPELPSNTMVNIDVLSEK
jgi:hypothetical protein